MKFINKQDLLSHGNKKLRTDILKVIDSAIKNVDPYTATINLVKIKNNILYVGQSSYDLSKKQNIYVLGAGKASLSIAIALEKLLQDKITGGIIIIKKGQYTKKLKKIQIIEASHPIPDKKGFEGAKAIIELTNKINNNDLVFTLITGGSSALAPLPEDGISLEDKIETNKLLLESGANILEINNIRKHISKIKGGRLAKNYLSHTQIINFIVSDVVGNNIKHESDWVMPDESTASDALNTLQKYNLLNKIPSPVINHLNTVSQNPDLESPDTRSFKNLNIDTFVLTNINKACEAAFHKAKNLGYNSMILNNMLCEENQEKNKLETICEAKIKVTVNGELHLTSSEGNGPVAALDKALRKALIHYYPKLYKVKLTDYKVRVVNESDATESSIRVLIESTDSKQTWTTVGASTNILEASWMALSDSMEWWLINNNISD